VGASVYRYAGKRGTVYRIKYRDASGREVMETVGAERDGLTEKQAREILADRLSDVRRKGLRRPRAVTFRDYAELWFEQNASRRQWTENTKRAYGGSLKRLLPHLGAYRLGAIRARMVSSAIAELSKRYSAATVNQAVNLLHDILASAVREELIEANPAAYAERPKMPDYEQTWDVPDQGEAAAILRAFTDERARLIYRTALLTGMRRSELVNLKWADVNFIEGAIRVRKSKTREGHRSIAMAPSLSAALWEWRTTTPYQSDEDYAFASPESGRRFNPDRWWLRHWKAALKEAGIGRYVRPFHDTRHTALTHMAAAGVSPVALMATAGHSSMQTTNTYLHLAGVSFPDAAEALERRLGLSVGRKSGEKVFD
jgi:integrase